jgi:nucleoside triphosphate diphosphatase
MLPSRDIADLLGIMKRLRDPETGCLWDRAQTFETIAPYAIEEAYEVADAITRGDMKDLKDELGDLLLQVVFQAEIAQESGHFSFDDVVEAITSKMIRRHPHVFRDKKIHSAQEIAENWKAIKQAEKQQKNDGKTPFVSLLDTVSTKLPPVTQSIKLQAVAAKVGFDWNMIDPILEKLSEEINELRDAIKTNNTQDITGEYGDMFFVLTNLARHLKIDPEMALRMTNLKFRQRFFHIETSLHAKGETLENASLNEMETLWQQAKSL